MNTTGKLQFFVGRLFVFTYRRQPASLQYLIRSRNLPLRAKDLHIQTSCICRDFSSVKEMKHQQDHSLQQTYVIENDEPPLFKDFVARFPKKTLYAQTLMKALECEEEDFHKISKESIYWNSSPIDEVIQRIKALNALGVKKTDLVEHSSVIFDNYDDSYQLLSSLCSTFGYNGHILFPLLLVNRKIIRNFLARYPREWEHLGVYTNRIRFFSVKLKVPARNFTEVVKHYPFLLTISIHKITTMMDILLDAGVDTKDILSDVFVFRYSCTRAKQRMNMCKEAGLKQVMPWMTRCSDVLFWKALSRQKAVQSLQRGLSKTKVLAKLLNCSMDEAEAMVNRDERNIENSSTLLKEKIHFLLSKGFSSEQMRQNPRIFRIPIKVVERRLSMMQGLNLEKSEIIKPLSYPSDSFRKYIQIFGGRNNTTSLKEASVHTKTQALS